MYGRYGSDQLSVFLLVVYLAFYLVSLFTGIAVFSYLGLVLILIGLYRMFSRNVERRRQENRRFLQLTQPLVGWLRLRRTIHKDKEHCYFKCPNCKQRMRVPRGKGKITVTCRSCGTVFQEKS